MLQLRERKDHRTVIQKNVWFLSLVEVSADM